MQTPGGTARPARRCGKPKRFDDTDSEEESPLKSGQRKATSGSTKRKVNFQDSATVKRQKVLSTKTLNHRPLLGQQMSGISASLSKQKAGPKSVQEKWKAQASMNAALTKMATEKYMRKLKDEDETQEEDDEEDDDDDEEEQEQEEEDEEEVEEEQQEQDAEDDNEIIKDIEQEEENGEEDLEGMLSEYRQMFGKPVVDMTKGNAMSNGSEEAAPQSQEPCSDCLTFKEELDHLEEMIKLKDCEFQEIINSVNATQSGEQKVPQSLADNIEKRIAIHKKYLETEKKLRNVEATREKWESLYTVESGKVKDLELRCEALEFKLKLEQKKTPARKPGYIEVQTSKIKQLMEIKNYHTKTCFHLKNKADMLTQEKVSTLKTMQKNEIEYKNKFNRMKKHYNMLLDHYIEKDTRYSKRKDVLEKKMSIYKDVGSRAQILRDAVKYLNANQMAFLEGQLTTEKTLCGKGNIMPVKYKELLLSLYQNSIITYKMLKSYNFNIPPILSIQQLSQTEVCSPSEEQFAILNERSNPVPADRRTLRALCSDEEDQEIADLLDASAKQQQDQSIMSDEEAEDGVDGDYGDVQPEEVNEEEEEEGGADYLSDDEPSYHRKMEQNVDHLEQQEYQSDLQQQLDNQLSGEFTAEPQFETMEATLDHGVHALVGPVDSLDHVVREVTHVEQLESIDPIQQHQIQISDMNGASSMDVEPPVEMVTVDAEHLLEDMGGGTSGDMIVTAGSDMVVSTGNEMVVSTGNEMVVRTGNEMVVNTGNEIVDNAVSDMVVSVGSEMVSSADDDMGVSTGNDTVVSAGSDIVVSTGSDIVISAVSDIVVSTESDIVVTTGSVDSVLAASVSDTLNVIDSVAADAIVNESDVTEANIDATVHTSDEAEHGTAEKGDDMPML